MEKLAIIGSGPAGLTAALYAARAKLFPVLIEGVHSGGIAGGQLMTANHVENYPAFPSGLEGPELIRLMREHVGGFGLRTVSADVVAANLESRPYSIDCTNGERIEAHAVIVATGATARRLPLDSEKNFWGKGVSACAICDGALPIFRNKPLAVIGGGDTAAESALHLVRFGSKITVVHRRNGLTASKVMQERLLRDPKVEILWNKTVTEFAGDGMLSAIRIEDAVTGEKSELFVAGAFEAIGQVPNTGFLNNQVRLDDSGHVLCETGATATSVEGVFAAGDVADRKYRQAITAAGSGCMAALDAERWLTEKGLLE
jgi:thioredoxin reductase (NADPH)